MCVVLIGMISLYDRSAAEAAATAVAEAAATSAGSTAGAVVCTGTAVACFELIWLAMVGGGAPATTAFAAAHVAVANSALAVACAVVAAATAAFWRSMMSRTDLLLTGPQSGCPAAYQRARGGGG